MSAVKNPRVERHTPSKDRTARTFARLLLRLLTTRFVRLMAMLERSALGSCEMNKQILRALLVSRESSRLYMSRALCVYLVLASLVSFRVEAQSDELVDHRPLRISPKSPPQLGAPISYDSQEWLQVGSKIGSSARMISGRELADMCSTLIKRRSGGKVPSPVDAIRSIRCEAYLFGLVEAEELHQISGQRLFCWDGKDSAQISIVVTRWIQRNRECKTTPAAFCATAALSEQFPCSR